jgi:hypothetical protein
MKTAVIQVEGPRKRKEIDFSRRIWAGVPVPIMRP